MQEKNIGNLSELLSIIGRNFSILEEEIDVNVQKDFLIMAEKIKQKPRFAALQQKFLHDPAPLFDENVPDEQKKQILIALASIAEPAAYRTLELFAGLDTPLKSWGVIALQQSRILLRTSLLDNPGIFISSGLGGQGELMRFFVVLFYNCDSGVEPYQKDLIQKETERAIGKAGGKIENIEFKSLYASLLILMPLDVELPKVLSEIVEECNQYGNFLYDKPVLTNVKKLSDEEIVEFVRKQVLSKRQDRT